MRIAWGFAGLIIIVGLALCVFWAMHDAEFDPRTVTSDSPPSLVESPDSAPVGSQGATISPPSPLVVRPFDPDGPPASDEPDALRVLVVDRETALPVGGAEVMWAVGNNVSASVFRADDPSTLIYDPTCKSNRTSTDAQGIAIVRAGQALVVTARADDRYGERRFETAPTGEIRVPIAPGVSIRAQVVDANDQPVAGVDVLFTFTLQSPQSPAQGAFLIARSRGPQGLAVAGHSTEFRYLLDPSATVTARARIPLLSEVSATVPLTRLALEPIRLKLPPTGTVTAHVLDPGGKPLDEPFDIELSLAPPAEQSTAELRSRAISHVPMRVRNSMGTARFEHVVCEGDLVLSARSNSWAGIRERLTTHPQPGREAEVSLRFKQPHPRVLGRLLGPDAQPLSQRTVAMGIVSTRFSWTQDPFDFLTDSGGRFSFPLDRSLATNGGGAELLFEVHASSGHGEHTGATLVRDLPAGDHFDLGDIQVGVPEVLAQGIVVDEAGAPMRGATVEARVTNAGGGTAPWRMFASMGGGMAFNSRSTAADGAFVILMPSSAPAVDGKIAAFALHATAPGFIATEPASNLSPGASEIRITLAGAGSIAGILARDGRPPVWSVKVRAARSPDPNAGSEERPQDFKDCINSDGTFELAGLLPGTYDLTFTVGDETEPRAKIDGVIVVRLETTRDPRLENLSLPPARAGR